MPSAHICGIHHIGIHVPDLEAGRRFYENVFGFEAIGMDNWDEGNPDINAYVGLEESAARSYMMRGVNTYVELWEYRTPQSRRSPAEGRASDHGFTHLCFLVDDFDAVLKDLLAAGGSLIKPLTEARPVGARVHYCRDPFGNIIELLQTPPDAPGRLADLPGIREEGAFAEPTTHYYVLENGRFSGLREK